MAIVQASVATPARLTAGRDTGIDLVRAVCVVAVVVLHAMMVGVTVSGGAPVFDNASVGTAWIAPLSWLLQVMPLFFVIGGFSGFTAYRRQRAGGGTATAFVAARLHRLLLPALVTIAAVGAALALLASVGVAPDLIATAGFRFGQPLWFLGVFLLCQALLPVMTAAHERAPLRTIGALAAVALLVDAARGASGVDAVGFVNLLFVWLTLQQVGFFVADGRIGSLSRGIRIAGVVGAVAALALAFLAGVYSPDLIANLNPPTTALLLVGIAHTGLLSLLRVPLQRWSLRTGPHAFSDFVNRRAMTIYLWHMPVLLAMAGASAAFALWTGVTLPTPDSAQWWWGRPLWLTIALALTAATAMLFAGIETATAPDATRSRSRITLASCVGLAAVLTLLIAGTTPVTAAIAVALLLAALRCSRPGSTSIRHIAGTGSKVSLP